MSETIPPRAPLPPPRESGEDAAGPDKDQYSLDEMMKALRDKEREKEEKGEVVTRSDGSVARKVKRRRRRSDQPEKSTPEKEKKGLLIKVIIAAVLLLALFLTGLFLLVSHNSKGYRADLEATAAEWTGAEVEFTGYKRLPFSATMEEANFRWPASSYLKTLEVDKLKGDVKFFTYLGARPGGLQFGGRVAELVTGMPTATGEVGRKFGEDEFPFGFEQYVSQALDVKFGEMGTIGIKGTSASLYYVTNAGWQTTLDSGVLQISGWKDFPISSGILRKNDGVLSLESLALKHPNEFEAALASSLRVSGEIPLKAGEKAFLKTESEHFPLEALLGEQLSNFFEGAITSSNGTIEYSVGNNELDEFAFGFFADTVKMSRFPFLINLREIFPTQDLDEIIFDNGYKSAAITGQFRARPEGVALERFEMAEKNDLRLKGAMIISKSGEIAGNAELSINRAFFAVSPSLKDHPILRSDEQPGYAVVRFQFGGTVDEPDDTFRHVMGMEARRPGEGGRTEEESNSLWEKLQKPTKLQIKPGE